MKCYKTGDVVLISFPFSNLAGKKVRPAMIFCDPVDADITCIPISSTYDMSRIWDLKIKSKDCENFVFPIESVVRTCKIQTIEQRFIRKKLGAFSDKFLLEIKNKSFKYLKSDNE